MNNSNGSGSSKMLKGCGIALLIAIAAFVILPIVAIVGVRVFGRKVEQAPSHVTTEVPAQSGQGAVRQ